MATNEAGTLETEFLPEIIGEGRVVVRLGNVVGRVVVGERLGDIARNTVHCLFYRLIRPEQFSYQSVLNVRLRKVKYFFKDNNNKLIILAAPKFDQEGESVYEVMSFII